MEREQNMVSLADALRDGASPDDIRKSFEAALQDAQNEVAAQQAEASKFCGGEKECGGDCARCSNCAECELDEAREDMIYAVLDYLTALGLIPEDLEIEDDDIDTLIESIKEVENEFKAKIGFMRMLADIARMKEAEKEEKPAQDKKVDAADVIIKQFLKGLH